MCLFNFHLRYLLTWAANTKPINERETTESKHDKFLDEIKTSPVLGGKTTIDACEADVSQKMKTMYQ